MQVVLRMAADKVLEEEDRHKYHMSGAVSIVNRLNALNSFFGRLLVHFSISDHASGLLFMETLFFYIQSFGISLVPRLTRAM